MGDARYLRMNRDLEAPGGRTLLIRMARDARPAILLRDGADLLRLDPAAAAILGAQLIGAAAIGAGRLDEVDAELVLQAAQRAVDSQVRNARRRAA